MTLESVLVSFPWLSDLGNQYGLHGVLTRWHCENLGQLVLIIYSLAPCGIFIPIFMFRCVCEYIWERFVASMSTCICMFDCLIYFCSGMYVGLLKRHIYVYLSIIACFTSHLCLCEYVFLRPCLFKFKGVNFYMHVRFTCVGRRNPDDWHTLVSAYPTRDVLL